MVNEDTLLAHFSSKSIRPRHLRCTRVFGYALTLADAGAWEAASLIWQARLEVDECAALATAALRSLNYEDALRVAQNVFSGVGVPLPPFTNAMDDALFWASCASVDELEAYALASFHALDLCKRSEFIEYALEADQ